jgi:hypothetical protein
VQPLSSVLQRWASQRRPCSGSMQTISSYRVFISQRCGWRQDAQKMGSAARWTGCYRNIRFFTSVGPMHAVQGRCSPLKHGQIWAIFCLGLPYLVGQRKLSGGQSCHWYAKRRAADIVESGRPTKGD